MSDIDKLYKQNEFGYKHQDPDVKLNESTIKEYKDKYGIKTDVHRTCVNCQIRQIEKYKHMTGKDPNFKIRCDFIPKGLPSGSSRKVREIA